MSAINLTCFETAKLQPSNRKTKCKNCDSMFGPKAVDFANGDVIEKKQPRIVVSGGWGPGTRHVSFCPECAEGQANMLRALSDEILSAVGRVRGLA